MHTSPQYDKGENDALLGKAYDPPARPFRGFGDYEHRPPTTERLDYDSGWEAGRAVRLAQKSAGR